MQACTTLASSVDDSVNHVVEAGDGGYFEARYVHRVPERWICYLSSHSGCSKACRFCHLTATRQTMMKSASLDDYLAQAGRVFSTYDAHYPEEIHGPRPSKVHFNFMARGEPLENQALLENPGEVFEGLGEMASQRGLVHAHKVSTIIPATFSADLVHVLGDPASEVYYSLYSMDEGFRKRWLPKAMPANDALDLLADYQERTGREINLHWAFIEGENDRECDVDGVLEEVAARGLRAKFNLVRYNPFSARQGREPDEARLQMLFNRIAPALGSSGSRIVPRVGFDIKASCGMFVEASDIHA
jgi:23S rRNA (adenine2503-C2)-methyltransferase